MNYRKWLVVWAVENASIIEQVKQKFGIEIVSISLLLQRMILTLQKRGSRDDILRVVELIALSQRREGEPLKPYLRRLKRGEDIKPRLETSG